MSEPSEPAGVSEAAPDLLVALVHAIMSIVPGGFNVTVVAVDPAGRGVVACAGDMTPAQAIDALQEALQRPSDFKATLTRDTTRH